MDDLQDRYAARGVSSAFIYSREAHPAEHYRHHRSFEEKVSHAQAFADHCQLRRPLLVDDIEGTVHRAYGLLPNMTWIVGRGGLILYKATWTDAVDVESGLEAALRFLERRREDRLRPFYSERLAWRGTDDAGFRAGLERNGPQAVTDFYGREAVAEPTGSGTSPK